MRLLAEKILASSHYYSDLINGPRQALTQRVADLHSHYRAEAPARSKIGRIGQAARLNALYGLSFDARVAVVLAAVASPPSLLRLAPPSVLHPFSGYTLGLGGFALLGHVVVGDYRRTTPDEHALIGRATIERFSSRGLAGMAVEELANVGRAPEGGSLALACLWSAAFLSVACALARGAVHLASALLSVATNTEYAIGYAVLASIVQLFARDPNWIFDFQEMFRPAGAAALP